MNYQKLIYDALSTYFEMEIENKVEFQKNQMIVFLNDGKKAKVEVKKFYKDKIKSFSILENNSYVMNHDFGYGSEPEKKELNKLLLRNFDDLKFYVLNIISISFFANVEKNIISFFDSKQKIAIEFEII